MHTGASREVHVYDVYDLQFIQFNRLAQLGSIAPGRRFRLGVRHLPNVISLISGHFKNAISPTFLCLIMSPVMKYGGGGDTEMDSLLPIAGSTRSTRSLPFQSLVTVKPCT